jgi:hypothetical protein
MHTHDRATHVTDDDLVLHYYGELAAPEEGDVAAHLDACRICRASYTRLQRVLGAVDERALEPAALSDGFERTVWARLEPNLRRERRGRAVWLLLSPAPLALAAAVVVLVAGAFFAGRALSPAPASPASPAAAPAVAEQLRERILLSDLAEHLDRSQMVLVELATATDGASVGGSAERERVEELVTDSRLYRQTAEVTGEAAVSQLLDDIARVLTEVAAAPDRVSADDIADMRRRIEARDLLFKVRVLSTEIRERQREAQRLPSGPRS